MIIVTGSGSGIGKAVASRMASLGHEVVGISKYQPPTLSEFKFYKADVREIKSLYPIAEELRESGKTVKAIINCAGIYEPSPVRYYFEDKVYDVLDTNLKGVINSCQAFVGLMDHETHSSIINISSLAAHMTNEASAYSASKAGVEAFTKSFAKQVSKTKIRANCIAPGPMDTGLTRNMPEFVVAQGVERQIINHKFVPDDVADIVELLMDPRSSTITGQVLNIGGV